MKHILPILFAGFLFVACDDSKDEFHQQYFYPQMPGGMSLFADQQTDTINFVSTDSWKARATADWFTISPTAYDIPAEYLQTKTPIIINVTSHTTDNIRRGAIEVDAYGSTLSMNLTQYPWLNIQYPAPTRAKDAEGKTDAEAVRFTLDLRSTTTAIPLYFVTYQPGATITSDAEWLTLPDTVFAPGAHSYQPAIPENTSLESRKATLTLTSGGVSNQILITQDGKSE